MSKSVSIKKTVLMPGDYHLGDRFSRIQTLLGSCVAMVFWHPVKRIGAMCHYVLPSRDTADRLDGRYADEFMKILINEIRSRGTRPQQYQVRLYGGANMFSRIKMTCADRGNPTAIVCNGCTNVSCHNQMAALFQTQKYGFTVVEIDMGGTEYRHLDFTVGDGRVALRKMSVLNAVEKDSVL